jgi:Flp pilus assembly protein TadB
MMSEFFAQHWALVAACVIAAGVALFVLVRLVQDSTRGRLAAAVASLRDKEKAARKAASRVRNATTRLTKLEQRADTTKPRFIEEAQGGLEDARALQKIADDQVLVARNAVRQIIVTEFPPRRQGPLRRRLLPQDSAPSMPFTMGA